MDDFSVKVLLGTLLSTVGLFSMLIFVDVIRKRKVQNER
jgi:hypothetical protein